MPTLPSPPPQSPIRSRQSDLLRSEETGEWSSPAFIKRARLSYGSFIGSDIDIFTEDDGSILGKGRKRTKFGRASGGWRYSSRSQSPEVEAEKEDLVIPEPARAEEKPVMMDEGCQTDDLEYDEAEIQTLFRRSQAAGREVRPERLESRDRELHDAEIQGDIEAISQTAVFQTHPLQSVLHGEGQKQTNAQWPESIFRDMGFSAGPLPSAMQLGPNIPYEQPTPEGVQEAPMASMFQDDHGGLVNGLHQVKYPPDHPMGREEHHPPEAVEQYGGPFYRFQEEEPGTAGTQFPQHVPSLYPDLPEDSIDAPARSAWEPTSHVPGPIISDPFQIPEASYTVRSTTPLGSPIFQPHSASVRAQSETVDVTEDSEEEEDEVDEDDDMSEVGTGEETEETESRDVEEAPSERSWQKRLSERDFNKDWEHRHQMAGNQGVSLEEEGDDELDEEDQVSEEQEFSEDDEGSEAETSDAAGKYRSEYDRAVNDEEEEEDGYFDEDGQGNYEEDEMSEEDMGPLQAQPAIKSQPIFIDLLSSDDEDNGAKPEPVAKPALTHKDSSLADVEDNIPEDDELKDEFGEDEEADYEDEEEEASAKVVELAEEEEAIATVAELAEEESDEEAAHSEMEPRGVAEEMVQLDSMVPHLITDRNGEISHQVRDARPKSEQSMSGTENAEKAGELGGYEDEDETMEEEGGLGTQFFMDGASESRPVWPRQSKERSPLFATAEDEKIAPASYVDSMPASQHEPDHRHKVSPGAISAPDKMADDSLDKDSMIGDIQTEADENQADVNGIAQEGAMELDQLDHVFEAADTQAVHDESQSPEDRSDREGLSKQLETELDTSSRVDEAANSFSQPSKDKAAERKDADFKEFPSTGEVNYPTLRLDPSGISDEQKSQLATDSQQEPSTNLPSINEPNNIQLLTPDATQITSEMSRNTSFTTMVGNQSQTQIESDKFATQEIAPSIENSAEEATEHVAEVTKRVTRLTKATAEALPPPTTPTANRRMSLRSATSPQSVRTNRSLSVVIDVPTTPKGHDASARLALEALQSAVKLRQASPETPKHNLRSKPSASPTSTRTHRSVEVVIDVPATPKTLKVPFTTTTPRTPNRPIPDAVSETALRARLTKALRTNLGDFTPLKLLRHNLGKKLDVLAIATSSPPEAQRAKHGPRHYHLRFNVTDPSVAPSGVVEIQVFRPYKEALPEVEVGDGVLLRNFTVKAEREKGFVLRSEDSSSWAVFRRARVAECKGPPVEFGEGEEGHVERLKEWFRSLTETQMERLDRANAAGENTPGGRKGKGVERS